MVENCFEIKLCLVSFGKYIIEYGEEVMSEMIRFDVNKVNVYSGYVVTLKLRQKLPVKIRSNKVEDTIKIIKKI